MSDQTEEKLKRVPIEYLWDGLVLSDNIYNYNGTVLLIPSGETVTKKKLQRLSNFGEGDNWITTYDSSYQVIMRGEDAPEEVQQRIVENQSGYTGLKRSVDHMLQMTRNTVQLKCDDVETVMTDVYEKLYEMEPGDIFQCINVPRPIDEKLQRHSLNVAFLNGLMGQWMKKSDEEIRMLVMIGILHDIGKTKVPEEILYAPRKLNPEEFETMKLHPVYSYKLLGNEFSEDVKSAVLQHHEKLNGTGYPDGLTGDEVMLFARITAITDVYDAMVSERSYKKARMPMEVLDELKKEQFEGLDSELIMVFVENMLRLYRRRRVEMSDETIGQIIYIPPNDMKYPIVISGNLVRQTDEDWYCARLIRE